MSGTITEVATLTAWEVWDQEHDKLVALEADAEDEFNNADSEVRGYDEAIADMEAELKKLQKKRNRWVVERASAKEALTGVRKVKAAHSKREPEQD